MALTVQDLSQARALQKAAAQSFENARFEPSNFDSADRLKELTAEAAFRYWLFSIDFKQPPPKTLPSLDDLLSLANELDGLFGAFKWWAWPIWNTCSNCINCQALDCKECTRLAKFASTSEEWVARRDLRDVLVKSMETQGQILAMEADSKVRSRLCRKQAEENINLIHDLLNIDWSSKGDEDVADFLDRVHGEFSWWAWPVWYTCDICYYSDWPNCSRCSSMLTALEPDLSYYSEYIVD